SASRNAECEGRSLQALFWRSSSARVVTDPIATVPVITRPAISRPVFISRLRFSRASLPHARPEIVSGQLGGGDTDEVRGRQSVPQWLRLWYDDHENPIDQGGLLAKGDFRLAGDAP